MLPAKDWGTPSSVVRIFAAYLLLSLAMIFWSRHAVNVAEVWFANAMLVALLLRSVMQSLPLAMLLALSGSAIANVLMSAPWIPSLGIGVANMTEVAVAVTGARLLNLRLDRHPDDRFFLKGLISLVLIAPATGALVGAFVINAAFGTHWPHEFRKWWVGDAMGMLILAPPLIAYSSQRLYALSFGRHAYVFWSTLLLSVGLTILTIVYFQEPFIILSIPLLFAAYRLGVFGTSLACTINIITIFILAMAEAKAWVPPLAGLAHTHAEGIAFYSAMTVIGPLLISIVIAQRKRMGRELEGITDQLRIVTDNVPALIGQLDAGQRYRFVNRKFEAFYGLPVEKILGKTPREIFGKALGQTIEPRIQQVLQGNPQQFAITTPLGRRLEVNLEPQTDRQDATVGFFVLAQDISDRVELESRLKEITDNVPALIAYLDDRLIYRFANERYVDLWGMPPSMLLGRSSAEVAGERYTPLLRPRQQACLKGERVELDLQLDDGRTFEMTYVPHVINAKVRGIYKLGIDITARKQAEARLFEAMSKSQMMLDSIGDAVIACDVALCITMMNPVAERMTGWHEGSALGRSFAEVVKLMDMQSGHASINPLEIAIRDGRNVALQLDSKLIRRDGTELPVEDSAAPIHNREGLVIGGILVLRDVSESRAMALKMSHLAQHDRLTDLPNQVLLHDRLSHALASLHPGDQGALLFIDLDHFKNINDSLGHPAGDHVLGEIAIRLRRVIRMDDTVSRQGGDEFMVLLNRLNDLRDAARVSEEIIAAIERDIIFDGRELHVSASIGIAIFPEDSSDTRTLMKQADTALYHAKQSGRGRYSYFTQKMSQRAEQRLMLEHALRRSLHDNELFLVYQPKYRTPAGHIIGTEALVRWQRPEGEVSQPDQFIALAEEIGLIAQIDAWVMLEACRQMRAWQDAGKRIVPVSVNVSLARLDVQRLLQSTRDALAISGLQPDMLEIEFTESQMFAQQDQTRALLAELRKMGVGLIVDDFGTGYSSLNYLSQYEFDTIKIDRSFVSELPSRPKHQAIVQAIIGMAGALGYRLIAEGVETLEEADMLRAYGCADMQGYYYSRPVSADACAELLSTPQDPGRGNRR